MDLELLNCLAVEIYYAFDEGRTLKLGRLRDEKARKILEDSKNKMIE